MSETERIEVASKSDHPAWLAMREAEITAREADNVDVMAGAIQLVAIEHVKAWQELAEARNRLQSFCMASEKIAAQISEDIRQAKIKVRKLGYK